jgi:hypothetical protein
VLRCLLLAGLLITIESGARGAELMLSPRALAEAIDIGQSRIEALRSRFHQPYRVPVSLAPIDYVDVVTPFRRVALAAETRARIGDRLFGQREARATLGVSPEQVDLLIELTFHPQNTLVAMPNYRVQLAAASAVTSRAAIDAREIELVPRFGARMQGQSLPYPYPLAAPSVPGGQPLSGGTILVRLDGRVIDPAGTYDVFVSEGGKEIGTARIDFRAIR